MHSLYSDPDESVTITDTKNSYYDLNGLQAAEMATCNPFII